MKKLVLLTALALISHTILYSQSCLPNGIEFTTQEQIDNFPKNYPNCKSIGGRLTISGSDITNLNGLSQLTSLNNVYIYQNNSLTSLYGLHNVTSVANLRIGTLELNRGGNPALTSLTGLNALTNISYDLEIFDNPSLTSLTGLDNLTDIGMSLSISENEMLSSIVSLKNVTTIGYAGGITWHGYGISINNTVLTSLEGLENLTNFRGGILISQNPVLTNISGLKNIPIDLIKDLKISDNPSLVTCDLENLCNYLKNPKGAVDIYNNATGCNSPVEVAHKCTIPVPCLPYGNYHFLSQSDITNFRTNYPDCKELGGQVYIRGNDIVSLNGLNRVSSINGRLEIDSCNLLSSLAGLDSLKTVGSSVTIWSNEALASLTGLDNLQTVGWGLSVCHNPVLTNLSGLDKLTSTTGGLRIEDNKKLTSLSGLDNVSSTAWIEIYDNPELTSIASLKNVHLVTESNGDLWIMHNYKLESLEGLNNITSVGQGSLWIESNTVLKDLKGLSNLTTVNGSVDISYNSALTSLAGLENLTSIEFDLWLLYNDSIRNLTGLENLNTLGRSLWIFSNPLLANLEGIENMDTASISDLYISENFALSNCAVKSICAYLAKPDAVVTIEKNLAGCNTAEEVKAACETVGVWAVGNRQLEVGSFPNPFTDIINIEYTLEKYATVNLTIFNLYGQKIEILVNEPQRGGTHIVQWIAGDLPEGIYFYRFQTDNRFILNKILKIQ
jgi:hypothetical protein